MLAENMFFSEKVTYFFFFTALTVQISFSLRYRLSKLRVCFLTSAFKIWDLESDTTYTTEVTLVIRVTAVKKNTLYCD